MPLRTSRDDQATLNLTPMIDIVFLLVIFFMVGTKFSEMEHRIEIEVPQVSDLGTLTAAPEKKVIHVERDGQVILDRQRVSLEELTATLSDARQQYADIGVLVRGDAVGPFQNVANVLDACRRAGVSEMGVSVRLARKDP